MTNYNNPPFGPERPRADGWAENPDRTLANAATGPKAVPTSTTLVTPRDGHVTQVWFSSARAMPSRHTTPDKLVEERAAQAQARADDLRRTFPDYTGDLSGDGGEDNSSLDGLSLNQRCALLAKKHGVSSGTIRRWNLEYKTFGLAGLIDARLTWSFQARGRSRS